MSGFMGSIQLCHNLKAISTDSTRTVVCVCELVIPIDEK
jgi:hypothetical protein